MFYFYYIGTVILQGIVEVMREGQGGGGVSRIIIKQVWYYISDGGGRGGICFIFKIQVGYNRSNGGGVGGGYMIYFYLINSVFIIGFYIRYDLYIYKVILKFCIIMGCV